MKIAVCDDDKEQLATIARLMEELGRNAGHRCSYFSNAGSLLGSIDAGAHFDLIILDILMPFMTGMDAAREIRSLDPDVKIAFISNSSDYAVDSYSVKAADYIIKPIDRGRLATLLDNISKAQEKRGDIVLFRNDAEYRKIHADDIIFAEISGKILTVHKKDGSAFTCRMAIRNAEELLAPSGVFVRTHRAFIVNVAHIVGITPSYADMEGGISVPISRNYLHDVRRAFLTYSLGGL